MSLRTTMLRAVVWTAAHVGVRIRFRIVAQIKNYSPSATSVSTCRAAR